MKEDAALSAENFSITFVSDVRWTGETEVAYRSLEIAGRGMGPGALRFLETDHPVSIQNASAAAISYDERIKCLTIEDIIYGPPF